MSALTYTTVQGDMWDSMAHSELGGTEHTGKLMLANRKLLGYYIFPAGIKLTLPLIPIEATGTLPPWR